MKKILILIFLLAGVVGLTGCTILTDTTSPDTQLGAEYVSVKVGSSIRLQASITGDITWSSSDDTIATVDENGTVKGIKIGLATITAKSGIKTSSIIVSVEAVEPEHIISISGNQNILVNGTTNLSAIISNVTTTPQIFWESSNENVATVDSNGVVTGLTAGLVTIKASAYLEETITKEIIILVSAINDDDETVNNEINNKTYEIIGDIDLTDINDTIVGIVDDVLPAIVGVSNYQYTSSFPGTSSVLQLNSVGSGMIFHREAVSGGYRYYVLTNYHVVEDRSELRIYFGDDEDEIIAEVAVQASKTYDLAVVTFISNKDITPITFGDPNTVDAGDFVIAIGNPTGYDFFRSVTFGMVSYNNRELSGESSIYIQHDAAINPGNSGGPLFDMNGKVIGVNTIKIVDTDVENIGFAISLTTIFSFFESKNILYN